MFVPSFASQGTQSASEESKPVEEQPKVDNSSASPAATPSQESHKGSGNSAGSKKQEDGGDYFDIPAFLRKQAD